MAEIGRHLLKSFSLWSQSCCFVLSWALCPHISHQLQINGHCLWTYHKPKDTRHWLPLIKIALVYSPRHFSLHSEDKAASKSLLEEEQMQPEVRGVGHSIVTSNIFCLLIACPSLFLPLNTPRHLYKLTLELLGSKNSIESEKDTLLLLIFINQSLFYAVCLSTLLSLTLPLAI